MQLLQSRALPLGYPAHRPVKINELFSRASLYFVRLPLKPSSRRRLHSSFGFEEVAHFLSGYPGMDTHLILPASMRTSDLKRAAERYEVFGPSKLLFTRLDETETFGPILSQSVRMGIPVSYLSRGQRIPEDLEAATRDLILDMVLKAKPVGQSRFGTAAA